MQIPVEIPAPFVRARPTPLPRLWGGLPSALLLPILFLSAALPFHLPPPNNRMQIPVEIPAPFGRASPTPLARLWGGLPCGLLVPILFLSGAVSAPLPPATGSPSSPAGAGPYEFRGEHSRDGIGKFYLGREIAQAMGHQAADWLERQARAAAGKTELLVASLPITPARVAAAIGAGTS